ncbi:MAG TPA: ABC transporter permease subunit [Clostridia bacterium]
MNKRNKNYGFIYVILGVLFLIMLWITGERVVNNDLVIPDIQSVGLALFALLKKGSTYLIILKTIGRLVLTIVICAVMTVLLAFCSYKSSGFENFFKPFFVILRTIPVASIIIILLFMIGNEYSPYFITAFVVLPVMYEGVLNGFFAIDSTLKDEIRQLSNVNFKIIMTVFVPVTLPYIIASFIQSFGLGLKVMVMSEFIAQPTGTIGYTMLQEKLYLDTADIFAWTLILVLFVFLVELAVKKIKSKIKY